MINDDHTSLFSVALLIYILQHWQLCKFSYQYFFTDIQLYSIALGTNHTIRYDLYFNKQLGIYTHNWFLLVTIKIRFFPITVRSSTLSRKSYLRLFSSSKKRLSSCHMLLKPWETLPPNRLVFWVELSFVL